MKITAKPLRPPLQGLVWMTVETRRRKQKKKQLGPKKALKNVLVP